MDLERIPVKIFQDDKHASRAVARRIAALIRQRQAEGRPAVLGLATGHTPVSVYGELIRMHRQEGLDLSGAVTFNLDEYWPIDPQAAQALGVPRGPMWSTLQSGTPVQLDSGAQVQPEQVMGPQRKGRKFSFVTDTTWVPGLPDFVADSDLLICEGMFGEDLAEDAVDKKHLTANQAAQIAQKAGVDRMGLIHYSPRYTERELKHLLHQARRIFPATFLTRDLQVIDLPFKE